MFQILLCRLKATPSTWDGSMGSRGAGKGVGVLTSDTMGQTRGTSGEERKTCTSGVPVVVVSLRITCCATCWYWEPFFTTWLNDIDLELDIFWTVPIQVELEDCFIGVNESMVASARRVAVLPIHTSSKFSARFGGCTVVDSTNLIQMSSGAP